MNKTTSMQTETQHKLAEKEINSSILISAGCGAIPVSYIDIAATITTQMRMVKNLCDIYEVKWDEHIMKGLLSSVLGNIGKRMGASMLKSIPIIGPIAGGFTNAILSGVSTYAIGHAFIKYIQLNSSIKSVKDIDVKAFTSIYDDFNKKASSVAQMIKDKLRGVGGTPGRSRVRPSQRRVRAQRRQLRDEAGKPHTSAHSASQRHASIRLTIGNTTPPIASRFGGRRGDTPHPANFRPRGYTSGRSLARGRSSSSDSGWPRFSPGLSAFKGRGITTASSPLTRP